MQEHAKRSGLIVIVPVCQVGAWEAISLSTHDVKWCKERFVLAFLGPKQLSTTHLWRGEGLLYTNMYRALTFDQSCSCCRAVCGERRSMSRVKWCHKRISQGSQYDWFQPGSCACHVGVQRCIPEHLKSKHLKTVH